MSNQNTNPYRKMAVTTASKEQVLIMLYEAAIQNCRKALDAMKKKDVPNKGKHIGKVHDIVNELNNTLDFDVGGQVARDLERLYNYMIEQLLQANVKNAPEPLEAVAKLLETLLDGWRGAIKQVNQQKAAGSGSGGGTK